MKTLKLLVLAVGLFVQGCDPQAPLFRDNEDLQTTQALIVFSIYRKFSAIQNILERLANKEPYAYMNSTWQGDNGEVLMFKTENHIDLSKLEEKFIVTKVPAGKYSFKDCSFYFSYKSGLGLNVITIQSPKYLPSKSPFEFSVEAGDVVYIGSIELITPEFLYSNSDPQYSVPQYILHNRIDLVKELVKNAYPKYMRRLRQ